MARQKKPVHRVQMTEGKRNIIHQLLEEYDIQSAEDIQDALMIIPGLFEPPVRTLRATIPENESHIFR